MTRSLTYWPGINRHVKDYLKKCSTCIRQLFFLPAEPLINYNISQGLLQKISTNFMDWDDQRYLLIVDYSSKYPFLFQISSTTLTAVIYCLTELCALKECHWKSSWTMGNCLTPRNGIPSQIKCFTHTTSNPHYPQSNAFIERHIHIMRSALSRAKTS